MVCSDGFGDVFGEESARFLLMCELVLTSHKLELLVTGDFFFIGEILPKILI
jgi:hypothetical protein